MKEIMQLKRTQQQTLKELRSINSVQDAIREQNTKRQNNQTERFDLFCMVATKNVARKFRFGGTYV